jgi:hypothetical protein
MSNRPTLQHLAAELDRLRERIEDLEDLRDLKDAIRCNADKPLIPWAKVKRDAASEGGTRPTHTL